MSPAIAAVQMTMRALIKRNAAADDGFGGKAATIPSADWPVVSPAERCFVWVKARRQVADGGKVVIVEDAGALFSPDADVRTGDRFTLKDRRDRDLFDGDVFEVDAPALDKYVGAILTHREVLLRRYRA